MKLLQDLVKIAHYFDAIGLVNAANEIDEIIIAVAAKVKPYRLGVLLVAPDGSMLLTNNGGKWDVPTTGANSESDIQPGDPEWLRVSYRQAAGFVQIIFNTAPSGQVLSPHVSMDGDIPQVVHLLAIDTRSKEKIDKRIGKTDSKWFAPDAVNGILDELGDASLEVLLEHPYTEQMLETGGPVDPSDHLAELADPKDIYIKEVGRKIQAKRQLTLEQANYLKRSILETNPDGIDLTRAHAQLRMEQPNRPRENDVIRMVREEDFTKTTMRQGDPRYLIRTQYKGEEYVIAVAFNDTKTIVVVTVFDKTDEDRPARMFGEGYDPLSGGAAHFGQG